MSKFFAAVAIFGLVFVSSTSAVIVPAQAQDAEMDPAALSQEAQRNRELLDIWKEHVKTLTQERDEAYKELESLKASNRVHSSAPSSAPLGQFGMESQAIPPMNRELQMQLTALQTQYQETKKELDELKAKKEKSSSKGSQKIPANRLEDMQQRINELSKDNESLTRALAAAQNDGGSTVSRVRQLESELEQYKNNSSDFNTLRAENQSLHDEIAELKSRQPKGFIGTSGSGSDVVSRERDAFMRQAKKLQYENDTLKVQLEKTKVTEKELQSTRSYFAPMVQDLQDKLAKANEENEQLKAQIQKTQSDVKSTSGTLESITKENEQLKSEIARMEKGDAETDKQLELIKSQLQLASADKDKIKDQDEELSKLREEKKALEKSYEELQANYKSQDAQFQQVSQQMSAMQKASEEWKGKESQFSGNLSSLQQELETLRAERVKHLRLLERYQIALRANYTDMQNLKSNFEAYLESLVASFEDRQK